MRHLAPPGSQASGAAVAVVEPLGADGETDPDQRDVENDEERQCQSSELEPVLSNQDQSKQEQNDNDHHRGDRRHPIGFPVQAALEREQQLRH
jgi:hypothetical protein